MVQSHLNDREAVLCLSVDLPSGDCRLVSGLYDFNTGVRSPRRMVQPIL
jgi:hypothetical protein